MLLADTIDYTFQISGFEGPLDLLLRLIEREELDITSIALAQVADSYLAHVRAMDAPDPASLSAFLVIAARLLLIKSRALLPRPPALSAEDQPDEAEQLVRQLQEYQRFKLVAAGLRLRDEQGLRSYTRVAPPPVPAPSDERLDVSVAALIEAVQRRMQLLLPLEPAAIPLPAPKILTVAQVGGAIRERLRAQEWFSFEDLLSLSVRRVEVIVTFWAVLELLKRRAIVVEQPELFGPIQIGRGDALAELDLAKLEDQALEDASEEGSPGAGSML
jgi:segregation and condensation protein A